ncbi:tetratricopeptide (TPR) repeat protein [Massilia sp. MP_M2]|uniref:tetratricopeptide repeat protein n=1 Tax=Massilia sp. MP_M2 TaxID=3071713 RepID=UPI00319DC4B5
MTSVRVPMLAALLALVHVAGAPSAHADIGCGQPCRGLVLQAQALEGRARYQEALTKYKAAEQADPTASIPLSLAAGLVLKLSTVAPQDAAPQLRDMSRALAERAARLEADDPVAQEVLRMLDDPAPSPLHQPNARAATLMAEGEAAFARQDLKAALARYEATMRADPQYSSAWVAAGNCHYVRRDWTRAEALFRAATVIEPHNAQAWRYLSDALFYQDKRAAAEAMLYKAIEADPSQRPNWRKLAQYRAGAGMPLSSLGLRRGVRVLENADGNYVISLDPQTDAEKTPDHAFRLALGMTEVALRTDDKDRRKSAFEIELESWRQALKIADEAEAKSGEGILDPGLLQVRALAREGQLEAAILLLMFRQAYRPALQAWIAANPGGVKYFIDRFGVQP